MSNPLVEFVSTETMINCLIGLGVNCESEDAGTWVGYLECHNIDPDEDIYIIRIMNTVTNEFIGATDIRNFSKITVL